MYCRIDDNNIIAEIIEENPTNIFHEDTANLFTECPNEVQVGWYFNYDNTYTKDKKLTQEEIDELTIENNSISDTDQVILNLTDMIFALIDEVDTLKAGV